MAKPKALLILPVLLVVLGVAAFALSRTNEPHYEGHSLSYWLARSESPEATTAIRAIGTNAIPHLLQCISRDPLAWKKRLTTLPIVYKHEQVIDFLYRPEETEYSQTLIAFERLGTNATPAIPALVQLMKDSTRPNSAVKAIHALAFIGDQALPFLAAALSDTNQFNRPTIVIAIWAMPDHGAATSACLVPILKATTDSEEGVRYWATNAIRHLAPGMLTNSPPR